jgi:heme O synthase-like polyprenyltransferase
MAHIAALLLILALFYFWLIGHWFARILMFPVFVAAFGLFSLWLYGQVPNIVTGGFGVALSTWGAWQASGAPAAYWRRRAAIMAGAGRPWQPVRG